MLDAMSTLKFQNSILIKYYMLDWNDEDGLFWEDFWQKLKRTERYSAKLLKRVLKNSGRDYTKRLKHDPKKALGGVL